VALARNSSTLASVAFVFGSAMVPVCHSGAARGCSNPDGEGLA
jgi:hypothetical protein